MKNFLTLILLLVTLTKFNCQLIGTANLQGQTDHSGIRVKFTAQGGTAVSDSTYTSASGIYSINITPGVYKIGFAKSAYIDAFYDNNTTTLLTNTTALNNISLVPGNAIFVSGNVSGTWSPANVYIVVGNITVAGNTTLTILPGTQVLFNDFYAIEGSGIIEASGNAGSPIIFSSNRQNKARGNWKHIGLTGTGSSFNHCIFEYASFALNFQQGGANVTNCVFRQISGTGIYISQGTPFISGNEFYDLENSTAVIGIWVEGSASGTITCNYIHDINSSGYNGYGIIHNSSLVTDNRIDNIMGPYGKGIQTRKAGARNLNNCISNAAIGIDIDGSWMTSSPLIANNTLFSNQTAIAIEGGISYPTHPIIVNNLIAGNDYGISQYGSASGSSTIDHNNLWNQSVADFSGLQIVGLGQVITTNSAGHAVDAFYNMYQDPVFISPTPLLSSLSPCYSSGNSAYSANIGFANPQGCSATIVGLRDYESVVPFSIYPNPSRGLFSVSTVPGEIITYTIYDLNGRTLLAGTINSEEKINVEHLENGIYLIAIKRNESVLTKLLAISK